MVLVVLQAELGDGSVYEARLVRLKTVPLHHEIESCHSKRQPRTEIVPYPMHNLFEMTDQSEHGKGRFDAHTLVPLATFTHFEIGRVSLLGVETRVGQNDHLIFKLPDQVLEPSVVDIGGIIRLRRMTKPRWLRTIATFPPTIHR